MAFLERATQFDFSHGVVSSVTASTLTNVTHFDEQIMKSSNNSAILLYVPWCERSQQVLKMWQSIASQQKDDAVSENESNATSETAAIVNYYHMNAQETDRSIELAQKYCQSGRVPCVMIINSDKTKIIPTVMTEEGNNYELNEANIKQFIKSNVINSVPTTDNQQDQQAPNRVEL